MKDDQKIIIYLVDDDASVRSALEMLILSAGMDIVAFASAEDFLVHDIRKEGSCLVTDVKMHGTGGLELQRKLSENGIDIPVIFLTAFDTKESREEARKGGAYGYFRKPVDDQALLDAIQWVVDSHFSSIG